MKIKIDREYTAGYQIPRIKEDITTFKAQFTDSDILDIIRAQLDFWDNLNCPILKLELSAFPAGSFYNDETCFKVQMILDGYSAMYKIRCYMDLGGDIKDAGLSSIEKFQAI